MDMPPIAEKPAQQDQSSAAPATLNIGLFGDIPRWIWATFLSAWALLFSLFVLFFATTPQAAFAVAIAVFFALMAFGLPLALSAQSPCENHDCRGMIHTRSGPLSVMAAATQILTIPIAAVIGLIIFITLAL